MTRLVLLALAALGALVAAFVIDARRINARLKVLDEPEDEMVPMAAWPEGSWWAVIPQPFIDVRTEWTAPFAIKPESWRN